MKFKYNHDASEITEALGIPLDEFNKVMKKADKLGDVVIKERHCRSNFIRHLSKYLRSVGVLPAQADEAALTIDMMAAHVRPLPYL